MAKFCIQKPPSNLVVVGPKNEKKNFFGWVDPKMGQHKHPKVQKWAKILPIRKLPCASTYINKI